MNSALPSSLVLPFFRSASSFLTRSCCDVSSFWYSFSSLVRRETASVAILRGEGAGILRSLAGCRLLVGCRFCYRRLVFGLVDQVSLGLACDLGCVLGSVGMQERDVGLFCLSSPAYCLEWDWAIAIGEFILVGWRGKRCSPDGRLSGWG